MKSKIIVLFIISLISGCKGFLDEYSESEVRPSELTDMEQMLLGDAYIDASKGEVMLHTMDIFTDDIKCTGLSGELNRNYFERNMWLFLWDPDMFNAAGGGYDAVYWELPYKKILGCNIVLDCLNDMTGEHSLRENLRGEALVLRSMYYLMLVNMYGMPYNYGNPAENLGIPLKLTMDVRDERFPRSTVAEVYTQIENDLLRGNKLLTEFDYNRNYLRINHLAAKTLLSRMYLYMENWDKAIAYADSVLLIKPDLLNLNSINWASTPIERGNNTVYSTNHPVEVIWMRQGLRPANDRNNMSKNSYIASDELLDLYGPCNNLMVTSRTIEDIRATAYFSWGVIFPITYFRTFLAIGGLTSQIYQGLRTAELYLNRAEAYIHKYINEGNDSYRLKALEDLNFLRKHRFNSALPYQEINITDGQQLLSLCRDERRRELVGDGQHRWCDLRRYGMPEIEHVFFENEGDNKTIATLKPNRYVLPIPEEIIRVNPQLKQNN